MYMCGSIKSRPQTRYRVRTFFSIRFTYYCYCYYFYRVLVEYRTRVCRRISTSVRLWTAAARAREKRGRRVGKKT